MIPDRVVEEVRARADIVELIGEEIPLKRAGKEFRALCPFHNEKTPSFYVVPAKNLFKCFGCGEAGDAFTFLMKRGMSFTDAVRHIAARVGIEIPEETGSRRQEDPNRPIYEAVAFAADWFQEQLWSDAGEKARRYLESRELDRKAAERFALGYAPDSWRAFRDAAHKHGIDDAILLAAGLIKQPEQSDREPYDRFRDRLIFPIAEVSGRWIAFGGRIVGPQREGAPKYLNSPETEIYRKGQLLYGLNWARNAIRREKKVLLVEGNMDFVSLAARGVDNVVAALGTAMTDEQAQIISRYAKQAILLYDSDTAGLKATFRTGDALLKAGVEPLVVTLPLGEDPDTLIRRGGSETLAGHIGRAVDVLDRKLQILEERGFFQDIEGIRRALDRLLPTIRATSDEALRDIYVARVEQRTGVRRATIERELRHTGPSQYRPQQGGHDAPRRGPEVRAEAQQARAAGWGAERLLLQLMLRDAERVTQAAAAVSAEQFRDPVHRRIFEALVQRGVPEGDPPADWGLPAPVLERFRQIRAEPVEFVEGDRVFDDAVADLLVCGVVLRLDEVRDRLSLAEGAELDRLQREETELHRELRALGVGKSRLGFKVSRRYRRFTRGRTERLEPPTGGD